MSKRSPLWIAPRSGQDWICEDSQKAVDWFRSFVPSNEMDSRLERCRDQYLANREGWENGELVDLFDSRDQISWFIFQAQTYAKGRDYWVPDESARIIPFLSKIGKDLEHLRKVIGVEERAQRLLTSERSQPDGGLYELLVAAAYKRRGWSTVQFVAEERGRRRTPDLLVSRSHSRWAVECKRILRSSYAEKEDRIGKIMASHVHDLSERTGHSFVLDVRFHEELSDYAETYLADRIADVLPVNEAHEHSDGRADILLRPVAWDLIRYVLAADYVYVGSSRMMEIVSGHHEHAGSKFLNAIFW